MEKVCTVHGLTKHNARPDGGYRCGKCASAAVMKRRKTIKKEAVVYMGSKCAHCQNSFPDSVFEFHHTDPALKDFGISKSGHCRSLEAVKAELDKCIMLCANCHRIEHDRLHNC